MEPVNHFEQPVISSTGVFECGDLNRGREGSNRNHGSILSLGDGAAQGQKEEGDDRSFDQCSCDGVTFAEYASMGITKIISRGQTGADRAGLDVAIALNIPHGGWCPKGRRSLDGPLAPKYLLNETPSKDHPQRTEWNVRDSDGTIIFTLSRALSGGSLKTKTFAEKHKKPVLHVSQSTPGPETTIREFIARHSIGTLNVAGSRESKEPGVYTWTEEILKAALAPSDLASVEGLDKTEVHS